MLLVACTPAPTPPPASGLAVSAQETLNAFSEALQAKDRATFQTQLSSQDGTFAVFADRLFDNVSRLPLTALRFHAVGQPTPLAGPRRAVLGPTAWDQPVSITWRLAGDQGAAEHRVRLTFRSESDAAKLAGAPAEASTDGRPGRVAEPIWWRQPVTAHRSSRVTLVSAAAGDDARWFRRADLAAAAVRARLPERLRRGWSGGLVVERPASQHHLEQVVGATPGSHAGIAAVAWPEGPDPQRAATRILLNPALARRLDDEAAAVLLTHEAVHVATRSAASAAPSWLTEGYADYLAYSAHPARAPDAERDLLRAVRADGPPTSLPPDSAFFPTAPRLGQTYAEAWTLCRFIATRHSPARLARLYEEADRGANLDAAIRSTLDQEPAELLAEWQRHLRDRAARS